MSRQSVAREPLGFGDYAGGRLDALQWQALSKLVKARNHTLIISSSTSEFTIAGYIADDLVEIAVAESVSDGAAISATPYGLELASVYGLDGRAAEVE